MAGKISDLVAIGAAAATTDLLELVDVSDASMAATGTNKKMLLSDLLTFLVANGGSGVVKQSTAPANTTVLWADTSQVGIEENVRYLSNVTGTAYTLALSDRGKLILAANAGAQTITVPTNATAAFVIGTQLDVTRWGAGTVTFVGAGSVAIRSTPTLSLRAQYSAASLIKMATDEWLLIGDLG